MPTEPSKPSPAQACATFERLLQEALEARGILAQRGVRIPGTRFALDLFIPTLPRAMVEVKVGQGQGGKTADLDQVTRYLTELRGDLGPTVQAILVRVGPGVGNAVEANLREGVHRVRVEAENPDQAAAQKAAGAIQGFLDEVRTGTLGLEGTSKWAVAAAAVAAGAVGAGVVGPAAPLLMGLGPFGVLAGGFLLARKYFKGRPEGFEDSDGGGLKPGKKSPVKVAPPPVEKVDIPAPREAPRREEVEQVEEQARSMLAAYVDLVPEGYPALAHEVDFLVEEFRQGHFTACALRAGRCLESIVYQLARHWGVEVQDTAFGVVHDLKQKVDHLGELVGDHELAPEERKPQLRIAIRRTVEEIERRSTDLLLSVHAPQEAEKRKDVTTAPRTLTMLLKRVQNRWSHLEAVRNNLDHLLGREADTSETGLVLKILGHRNRAAHAGADGIPHEADQASILPLLTQLNIVIRMLSNAGIAIRKERAALAKAGG